MMDKIENDVYFVVAYDDGSLVDYIAPLDKTVLDIISDVKYGQGWMGGRFIEITIITYFNGRRFKHSLDLINNPYNILIEC